MRTHLPVFVVAAVLCTSTPSAGGWGVITFEQLPDVLPVGEVVTVTMAVRGHGRALVPGLRTGRMALARGRETVQARVVELSEPGRYGSEFTVPSAGTWVLTASLGYTTAFSITAAPRGTTPHRTLADRGQQLFSTKGCIACHRHEAVALPGPGLGWVPQDSPNLTGRAYPQETLAALLASPPCAADSTRCMPKLGLKADEAVALGAFLNTASVVATAAR